MTFSKKYKHKITKSFRQGMGQYIIDNEEKFFLSSAIKVNENGTLTLAKNLSSVAQTSTPSDSFVGLNSSCCSNSRYSFFVVLDSLNFKVYRSSDGTNFSLVATIVTDSDIPHLFISFNSFLLITGYNGYYYYSSNDGSSWDILDSSSVGDNFPVVRYFTEHDKKLWLATDNVIGYIDDPTLGFNIVFDTNNPLFYSFEYITYIFSLSGSLYFINDKDVYIIENNNTFRKVLHLPGYADVIKFSDVVYFLFPSDTHGLSIYSFDGLSLFYQNNFSKIVSSTIVPVIENSDYAIFIARVGNVFSFFRLLKNGSLFLDYVKTNALSNIFISSGFQFLNNNYYLEIQKQPDPDVLVVYKENSIVSAGTLTQSMIVEPDIIPQGIILITDPLPAGASVKVYHSSNGGTSFSSALINHNVENATSSKYFFPAGTKIDLSMLKLELLATSTNAPIVHYIDFFYTPSGVSTL